MSSFIYRLLVKCIINNNGLFENISNNFNLTQNAHVSLFTVLENDWTLSFNIFFFLFGFWLVLLVYIQKTQYKSCILKHYFYLCFFLFIIINNNMHFQVYSVIKWISFEMICIHILCFLKTLAFIIFKRR